MSQPPTFTIGIPTWNRAAFLQQAIDSALRQTERDLELIVSDNASTDETPAVMAQVSDPRLRYVRQPVNLGGGANINWLIEAARGRFFVLHQDDDLLHPEFLARCRQAVGLRDDVALFATATLSGHEAEGVLGEDLNFRDAPWRPSHYFPERMMEIAGVDAAIMLLFSLPFLPPGIAFRTEYLRQTGGFFAEFGWAGDNLTIARVALRGTVWYDPRPGAFLRFHTGNASSRVLPRTQRTCRREANRRILRYLDETAPDWPRQARTLLRCVASRKKWKFLAEAWEADYPPVLKRLLADDLAGQAPVRRFAVHCLAALVKAKFSRVVRSRFMPAIAVG